MHDKYFDASENVNLQLLFYLKSVKSAENIILISLDYDVPSQLTI